MTTAENKHTSTKPKQSKQSKGQKNGTMGITHVLNTVNLGSIPGTTYDPANPPEVIPEYRIQE